MGMIADDSDRYDFSQFIDKVRSVKSSPVTKAIVKGRKLESFDPNKSQKMGFFNKRYKYKPSAFASEFHNATHRYRYLCWGIKSGKTKVGAIETCRYAQKFKNIMVWVVGPTNKHTEEAERMVLEILDSQEGVVVSRKESDREYVLYNGTKIQFRTGAKPNNLRGPNVHFAWLDEAAFGTFDMFKEVVKRTSATKGKIICTTTPYGKNWFYDECVAAGMPKKAPYGEFESSHRRWVSHRKTADFPWVDEEDLQDARERMGKTEFEQEYEAKFNARINAAFKKVTFHWKICKPLPGKQYIMGVDLGKSQDYTAIVVIDGKGFVMFCKRWKDVEYSEGERMIKAIWTEWNKPALVVDESNIGQVVIENLLREGMGVCPVNFNSAKIKNDVVQAHQIALENGRFVLPHPESDTAPPDADVLREEHEEYRVFITEKGRISYSAMKGEHDDMVCASTLANWGRMRALASLENGAQAAAQSLQTKEDRLKEIEERKKKVINARQRFRRRGRISSMIEGRRYQSNFVHRRRVA